jgi:hypothetical protein
MKRRSFINHSILGSLGLSAFFNLSKAAGQSKGLPVLRVGICADLHQDIIPDGERRLSAFIAEMNLIKADFIIQMGDLCIPKAANKGIIDIWNAFTGPGYHVIGNHDTDDGYSHDQVLSFWNDKAAYYSLVFSGHHHQDYHNIINGVHYVQINSMSYQWMGTKYAHSHYSETIEEANHGLKYVAPYKDPIWAMLTIYQNGVAEIKGKRTVFIPPTPEEMNRPVYHSGYPDVPYISDREFQLNQFNL